MKLGITSGMQFDEYLAFLFDFNERLAVRCKFSDDDILRKLRKEFPSHVAAKHKLAVKRTAYNRGILHPLIPVPIRPSFPYVKGVIATRLGFPQQNHVILEAFKEQYARWKKAQRLVEGFNDRKEKRPTKFKGLAAAASYQNAQRTVRLRRLWGIRATAYRPESGD